MDITEKFKEIEQKSPFLVLKVTGKITNMNGQGATRIQDIKKIVYSHLDTEITGTDEVAKQSMAKRTKTVEVHTFPKNGSGQIVAPIGGRYGYIMGALKTALSKYGTDEMKRKTSPAYGLKSKLNQGVFVEPEYIDLGNSFSNPPDQPAEFFITRIGVCEYFDFIREAPIKFTIRVESKISEDIMLELLSFIQRLGMGAKRRGLLKIERIERLN